MVIRYTKRRRRRAHARRVRLRAAFGLPVRDQAAHLPRTAPASWARAAAELDAVLEHGQIALITGPSGSGKSSILRLLRARLVLTRRRVVQAVEPPARVMRENSAVDLARGPLHGAVRSLALAGLADAPALVTPLAQLSDGQRARAVLGLAIHRALRAPHQRPTVLADEFGSTLDRLTARNIAFGLRRWLRREPGACRLIVATAHDDLIEPLEPDVVLYVPLGGDPVILKKGGAACTNSSRRGSHRPE